MFAMNKDTMMMVGLAVALLAVFYLYREVQKNKAELKKFSDAQFPKSILKVSAAPVPVPVPVPVPTTPAVADEPEQ